MNFQTLFFISIFSILSLSIFASQNESFVSSNPVMFESVPNIIDYMATSIRLNNEQYAQLFSEQQKQTNTQYEKTIFLLESQVKKLEDERNDLKEKLYPKSHPDAQFFYGVGLILKVAGAAILFGLISTEYMAAGEYKQANIIYKEQIEEFKKELEYYKNNGRVNSKLQL